MVGGQLVDVLDVDPRSGGSESVQRMAADGDWPDTYGSTSTPSGGAHHLIAPLGLREANGVLPGVDYQGGDCDGEGRAFVFLPPTVRRSKVDGQARPYEWTRPPDLEALRGAAPAAGVRRLVLEHARSKIDKLEAGSTYDDPFQRAEGHDRRLFTQAEAQDFVRPALLAVGSARVGGIEEAANACAAQLSHFVPEFWSAEQAMGLIMAQLACTAYDPDGPSEWTADKFWPVLRREGGRVRDAWVAGRRAEAAEPASALDAATPAAEVDTRTVLEKLTARLVSAQELADLPAPEPLVYGLLDMNSEAWAIGAPESFKSFCVLDLAGHVGAGKEWQGHRVRQGKVIYVAAEGAAGMTLRTRAWIKRNGEMKDVLFLPLPVQVKSARGEWAALVEMCRAEKPALVVVDTQARVTVGLEENSATDFGYYASAVTAVRVATGACVLTVHHTGRDGLNARGSSAIDGAQDTELKFTRAAPNSALTTVLKQDKQKDMAKSDEGMTLRFEVVDLGLDPHTGRALSSLVMLPFDPYANAAAPEIHEPQPWTKELAPNAPLQRQILQTLRDQGGTIGLTEAKCKASVADRWYGGVVGKGGNALRPQSWSTAWTKALERRIEGEAVAVNVSGQRWGIDAVFAARIDRDEVITPAQNASEDEVTDQ
jgi:hypothetical protein